MISICSFKSSLTLHNVDFVNYFQNSRHYRKQLQQTWLLVTNSMNLN